MSPRFPSKSRGLFAAVALYWICATSLRAESFFESRYQYYQEDRGRIRVDSNYSLFSIDLKDSATIDGSFLYSVISGASPTGQPPPPGSKEVPVIKLNDERSAFTLGLSKPLGINTLKLGYAFSTESDYVSRSVSVQDTISLNQKNTELVLGFAYTDDIVGANGSKLAASKESSDVLLGINQVLSPNDLLTVNLTLGWRHGFLSDPYKIVPINAGYAWDKRPGSKFEQLLFVQWTHYFPTLKTSVETSYRFGHNDWGSQSHTARFALYRKFLGDRLILGPSFRYYRQSAANFYATSFTGTPSIYSADYRLSAEQSISLGAQMRFYAIRDRLAIDLGYERYAMQGLDHKTSQSAYPSARCVSVGLHFQF